MSKLSSFMLGLGLSAMVFNASAEHSKYNPQRTDFRDETIYFAMTTRFYDGDPMNNVLCWDGQTDQIKNGDPCWRGDFAGLIDKLDYIKALGFTAIWITPVVQNASGFDYHGYHAMDFSKVDLRYESHTSATDGWDSSRDVTFKTLIDAAHEKDIKIILDIVLNHTGNFGEEHFAKLFDRDPRICNQAAIEGSMKPAGLLAQELNGASYWDQLPEIQFKQRFKYLKSTDGFNGDKNNYWHHVANNWNWDFPSRWWGQIAGDCVDLNTENKAVADYLVKCYGEFIKMGVDGFRIDTTGHISRLTFNSYFIPEFLKIAEEAKGERLNGCDFFMFGECCARYGGVTYRDQANLSSYFYTWKSDQSYIDEFKSLGTAEQWSALELLEGHAENPVLNMETCEKEPSVMRESDNVFMKNGAWHKPDYKDYSGFSIIDFPMHYNFNNVGQAVGIAKEGDKYYNDASYNVVYVDSHDYCPGPNDGIRFNGGTAQWADNLSFMFTFRGIPCIYYGSEVEFQKGCIIDKGPLEALQNTGRAYFGEYLEGSVEATDFGEYTADGNVATTLDGDLAHHIRLLNKIRAAVPALRKGQYTWDGCSANGGYAFKRATEDNYALVALSGGATFTNVPDGTYTEVVTGQTYKPANGTITIDAPHTQGMVRVLVKDYTGKTFENELGKFIYSGKAVDHKGNPTFPFKPTTHYYSNSDVIGDPSVILDPTSGSFKTADLTVTATLSKNAASGWYQIDNGAKVAINGTATFKIGADKNFGDKISVKWGAKNSAGTEFTGQAEYKKVDPNATITIYVKAASAPYLYAWTDQNGKAVEHNGSWPGKQLSATVNIKGDDYYYLTVAEYDNVNVIFNNGGSSKTDNINGIDCDTFFEYDGGTGYKKLDVDPEPTPTVILSPKNVSYKTDTYKVTATLKDAESGWYRIDNGEKVNLTPNTPVEFTVGEGVAYGATTTVTWSATAGEVTETGSATYTKIEPSQGITIYVKADNAPRLYVWDNNNTNLNGNYPGDYLSQTVEVNGDTFYYKEFDAESLNLIISYNGDADKTNDIKGVTSDKYIWYKGNKSYEMLSVETVQKAEVKFSPNGGTFTTQTIDVTATCNDAAVSAWYKIGEGSQVTFTGTTTFTIGEGVADGASVKVTWGAVNSENDTNTGNVTFTKKLPVVPDITEGIHVYLLKENNDTRYLYVWNDGGKLTGDWPGKKLTETTEINGKTYYVATFDAEKINLIVNCGQGQNQSKNFEGVTKDVYIKWSGDQDAQVTTLHNPNEPVDNSPFTVYFDNSKGNWNKVHLYVYGGEFDNHLGDWNSAPQMTDKTDAGHHTYVIKAHDNKELSLADAYVIFKDGEGNQTKGDYHESGKLVNYGLYNADGFVKTLATGIDGVTAEDFIVDVVNGALYIIAPEATTVNLVKADGTVVTRNINQGLNIITDLNKGFYIVGDKKVVL